jgi:hypothetical protein
MNSSGDVQVGQQSWHEVGRGFKADPAATGPDRAANRPPVRPDGQKIIFSLSIN